MVWFWCVRQTEIYLYNNSFYIQQTVIIYLMAACVHVSGEREYAVCALALWQILAHTPHTRHTSTPSKWFFCFRSCRTQAQKCAAKILKQYFNEYIVFLHCVRKPAIDFVVGNCDGIDTMQCAWFVVFFFLYSLLPLLLRQRRWRRRLLQLLPAVSK